MAIKKGLDITRESWQVLKADKELLIFPVMSSIAATAIVVTVLASAFLIPGFGQWALDMTTKNREHSIGEQALGVLCLFVVYFIEWFVAVFFNTALVGCALIRFSGGDPTVKDGLRISIQRLPQILAWTLVVAAVGTILSAIEQRLGWLGQFIIRMIGLTWAVATYFVVPVLAAEGTGPVTSVRRSVALLRKTWGEGLTGNFAIGVVSWLVAMGAIVLAAIGFGLAAYFESIIIAVVTGAALVLSLVLMVIVSSALKQVFLAGLYRYATTGEVPMGFTEATMQQALKSSKPSHA